MECRATNVSTTNSMDIITSMKGLLLSVVLQLLCSFCNAEITFLPGIGGVTSGVLAYNNSNTGLHTICYEENPRGQFFADRVCNNMGFTGSSTYNPYNKLSLNMRSQNLPQKQFTCEGDSFSECRPTLSKADQSCNRVVSIRCQETCGGRCGNFLDNRKSCQCNGACVENNDCCADFLQECTRIRLEGTNPMEGVVVIEEKNRSRDVSYVCQRGNWLLWEASAACSDLGYHGNASHYSVYEYEYVSRSILHSYVKCESGDTSLGQCEFSDNTTTQDLCTTDNQDGCCRGIVGIRCTTQSCRGRCSLYNQYSTCQCDKACLTHNNCCPDFWSECLDVRLTDGYSPNEGRVELVLGSESIGSICDEGWSIMDATVTCNQLGYPGASLRTMDRVFGSGNLPLIATKFFCNGDESKITDCPFSQTRGFCPSGGGAGVICQKPGYQGCFGRSTSSLLLRDNYLFDSRMTGDRCIQHCSKGKYELAAVRGTDCTCGLGIPIDSDYYHDFRCRMPCPGDSLQVCGGYTEGRLMVYKTNTGFCRHPGDPSNGQRLDDYFRFGAKVRFHCNAGFRLGGNTTIQCIPRDDNQRPIKSLAWSGIAPVCIGNRTSVKLPGPSKGRSDLRNVIIGLVVAFLVIIILLILLLIWRLRRKMSKEPPPPPVPMSAANDPPPASDNAVQANAGARPVYAKLTPKSDRGSTTNGAEEKAENDTNANSDGQNTNVNKCMPTGYCNPGMQYFMNTDDHALSAVRDNSAVPGKVFYSTKIKKKLTIQY